jgi:lambda family phage portal protein
MTTAILDASGTPVPASYIAGIRSQAFTPATFTPPFRSGSFHSQELAAWRPSTMSADAAIIPNRDLSVARVRDLVRNDPHAVAGVSKLVDMIIGPGLRWSSKPDMRALGLDPLKPEDAKVNRELGAAMDAEWRAFAEDPLRRCDAQRRLSMNGMFRLLCRTWVINGETTASLGWKNRGRYSTCVRAIDPDRLSNPNGAATTATMRLGVEFDIDGEPLAYHVRNGHPSDYFDIRPNALTWTRIPRSTKWGRPVFIHGFEPDREDQARAITPFAALIQRMRMIGKFADTELASATVNALFAAFVKSSLPVDAVNQAFTPQTLTFADKRMDYYAQNPAMLNGVRVPVMPVGDEVQINNASRNTTSFADFQSAFLQSIASALGISYEQLAGDWSMVNYSSARAALNEVWRHIRTVSAAFTEQVADPIRLAVMEEAFDRGYVAIPKGLPDFWDLPGAYLRGRWIGPGRGYVDPVKEAQGASLRMGTLTATLESENADQGLFWEETIDQVAYEEEMLKARRLTRTISAGSGLLPDPSDAGNDAAADAAADKRPGQ